MSDFDTIAKNLSKKECDDAILATYNIARHLHDMYIRQVNETSSRQNMEYFHHYFYGFIGSLPKLVYNRMALLKVPDHIRAHIVSAGLWAVTDVVDTCSFPSMKIDPANTLIFTSFTLLARIACIKEIEIKLAFQGRLPDEEDMSIRPKHGLKEMKVKHKKVGNVIQIKGQ